MQLRFAPPAPRQPNLERFGRTSLVAALALAFVSCGGRATWTSIDDETSGDTDPESEAPLGSGGTGTGGTLNAVGGALVTAGAGGTQAAGGSTFGGVEAFCEDACDVEPNVCIENACKDGGECLTLASRWPDDARKAFALCIENDPLCFDSAESCILGRLFEGEPLPVRVIGSGLSNEDGTRVAVHAAMETGASQVVDGGFSIAVPSHSWRFSGPAIVWVDENGNGTCDDDLDRFTVQFPTFNGDFQTPIFELAVGEDDLNPLSNDLCGDRF